MGVLHLIRHGQASFGSANYDQLSKLGYQQAASLGAAWEAANFGPTQSIAGSLQRHAQTAIGAIDACGIGDGYDVDPGWNEYDHQQLAHTIDPNAEKLDSRDFQKLLNKALDAWMAADADAADSAGETYRTFSDRVERAFSDAVGRATSGEQVMVFTSGGPIAWVTSRLLTGGDSLFQQLNDVVVNASITTIIVGQSGPRLLTFNEHTHLPRNLVTFR